MESKFKILLILALLVTPYLVSAQTGEAILKVIGEVITPLNITTTDFTSYNQVKLKHKDKEGKEHIYSAWC